MTTETTTTIENITALVQEANITDFLLHYLKQNGFKLLKEDDPALADKKENIIAVSKHGRKELIEVKGFPVFFTVKERKEEQPKKADSMLHAIHSFSEALLSSFFNFGRYFTGEKLTLALALPDTERYRQIIEKLEDYFTDNDLDFKVYLVTEEGEVQELNLNVKKQDKETAVPKKVMESRKQLREI